MARGLRRRAIALAVLCGMLAIGCGKRGAPLPPLRPIPGPITDAALERSGPRVLITFTIPSVNADGTTPAAADRIDVFAVTQSADAPAPGINDLLKPEVLVKSVTVGPVPVDGDVPRGQASSLPFAGQSVTVEDVSKDPGTSPGVRYYALLPAAGRRRGPATPIFAVRLGPPPAAPTGVVADNTETDVTVTWRPGAAKEFIVQETDERGQALPGALRARVTESAFQTETAFGKRRCFVVRAVETSGAVSILGEPAAPACQTPVDTFPPPAPTGLQASATDDGIELSWTAVTAGDLRGYIVLRAEGANGTLQPLTPAPIAETAYRDRAVQSGVTYAYAVVAVDAATPPNRSEPSARQIATARVPSSLSPHR